MNKATLQKRCLRDRGCERGSAYIVTLLAMVVLTIIGLSLSLITQSEMQIGANELTLQRVFYAADAGIAASTAQALVKADYRTQLYVMEDKGKTLALNMQHEVDVSPFYPILDAPCNLCEINDEGTHVASNYKKINYAVTSTARRVGGPNQAVLAQKSVSRMIDVQPWRLTNESLRPIVDQTQLKKIKF